MFSHTCRILYAGLVVNKFGKYDVTLINCDAKQYFAKNKSPSHRCYALARQFFEHFSHTFWQTLKANIEVAIR